MSSKNRVNFTAEAIMAMKDNAYADRDLRAVEAIFNEALDGISDEELALLDRAGDKDSKDRGQLFGVSISAQPDKYEMSVKDSEGKDTGEKMMKDILRYRIWVNFGFPQGACIAFNPNAYLNKLTMGNMSLLMKGEDGKFMTDEEGKVQVFKGLSEIKAILEGEDPQNPVVNAFYNVLEALGKVAEIKEKPLQGRAKSSDYKPYFVAQETQKVIDGENDYMPDEVVEMHRSAVDKMMVLAMQIAEVAPAIKVEKENQKLNFKYEVDAKIRISVEKRMTYVKDENGKVVKGKDGKDKLAPAKDENGNIIYDAKMTVPDAGINFNIDVTDEVAKIKKVEVANWIGGKRHPIAKNFSEVSKNCSEEVKAYIKAISDAGHFVPYEPKENENSHLWDLTQKINDLFIKESPDYLDKNGNKEYNEKGAVKKENYAIFDKEYKCIDISFRTEPNVKVRINEGKEGALYATYTLIAEQKGGSAPRVAITTKNIDQLIKSDVVKKALKENVPFLEGKQAQAER